MLQIVHHSIMRAWHHADLSWLVQMLLIATDLCRQTVILDAYASTPCQQIVAIVAETSQNHHLSRLTSAFQYCSLIVRLR